MKFVKKYLNNIYAQAMLDNDANVCKAIKESGPFESILDVGCWDGTKTLEYAKNAKSKNIFGIEIVENKSKEAQEKGIKTFSMIADRDRWPFEDGSVDCVTSNQVIEHLSNVDHFLSEASRVLKKDGVLITSTNNLSSWHNIVALVFGWAPFDLTNSSIKAIGIGNPLALHKGESSSNGDSWTHKTIFTTKWLNDWMLLYGLNPIKNYGAGYYPLPSFFGAFFKKHSAFITIVNKK